MHIQSRKPKNLECQICLREVGKPTQALRVLLVSLSCLLLFVGLVWLGGVRRHHHIADTRSERARSISTQTGPFHWLHFFPDERSSVTARLAATQPVTAAQALESDSWPKIYIYGLPKDPFRTLDRSDDDAEDTFRTSSNYAAEMDIPEAIRGSELQTKNASEADFFLVDAWLYAARISIDPKGAVGTADRNRMAVDRTLNYVQQHYPYWKASSGSDHLWIITQDHGYCGFQTGEQMLPRIEHSVKLVHWALMDKEVTCDMDVDIYEYGCWSRISPERRQYHLPCFVPGRDTAIASTAGEYDNAIRPFRSQVSAVRDIKLFFSGSLSVRDVTYSHGVRQTLYMLFNNTPGFKLMATDIEGSDEDYMDNFGRSLFCIAATGAGWGVRLKLALMHGCIPVIIADHVQMPYEDVLPYPDFAVHLPEHALYRLPEVLDKIINTKGLVQKLQEAAACVWRYFTWRDPQARALDALICSLRRKLTGGSIVPHLNWTTCTLTCDL